MKRDIIAGTISGVVVAIIAAFFAFFGDLLPKTSTDILVTIVRIDADELRFEAMRALHKFADERTKKASSQALIQSKQTQTGKPAKNTPIAPPQSEETSVDGLSVSPDTMRDTLNYLDSLISKRLIYQAYSVSNMTNKIVKDVDIEVGTDLISIIVGAAEAPPYLVQGRYKLKVDIDPNSVVSIYQLTNGIARPDGKPDSSGYVRVSKGDNLYRIRNQYYSNIELREGTSSLLFMYNDFLRAWIVYIFGAVALIFLFTLLESVIDFIPSWRRRLTTNGELARVKHDLEEISKTDPVRSRAIEKLKNRIATKRNSTKPVTPSP